MGKQQGTPSFGTTVQEVDNNIAAMNLERDELAKKQGTKDFDNKRFEQLSNDLTFANKQRSSMQLQKGGLPSEQTFNQQVTTVPAEQTGLPSTTTTTFNTPAINPLDQPQSGSLLGSIAPGQEFVPPQTNDISLLNTGEIPVASTSEIPVNQTDQGILQNFLGSIDRTQGGGIGSQINTAMFQKPGAYKSAPKVDIGAEDLFFAANQPILKGNVSGSFMGSQPIFAPGGNLFPTQVLNRRQKAIQDAAIAKKQQEQAFLSQRAPMIKDKGFQQSLNKSFNNEFNSMVDQAKETYGDGWYDAITDQSTPIGREFVNFSDNMNFIAGAADQTADEIKKTRTAMDKGDLVFSDETSQMLDDYENLQGQFAGGNIESTVNLRQEYGKLQGAIGLDTFLNDKNIDVKATVTGFAHAVDTNDAYITEEGKRTEYEKQLRQLANDWATKPSELSPLVRSGMITEEDIFNHLQGLYGYDTVSEKSRKVTNKPDGGGAITINMEGTGETTEKTQEIGGTTYDVGYSREISTGGKPMEMSGMYSYDANGKLVPSSGVIKVDPNAAQAVKVKTVGADGTVKYEWKPAFVGTTEETVTTGKGTNAKTETKTVTKLYAWDDNTKKKWMTDHPELKEQIEQTDTEIKNFIENNSGTTPYNKAEEAGFE